MKKLFTLAILLSSSLTGQCFATESNYDFDDSEEKKFYVGASVSVLGVPYYKDKSIRDHLRGSIIGGYNYTESIRAELEGMFGFPAEGYYIGNLLANLRYSHKIKDSPLAPYFGVGIGIGKNWGSALVGGLEILTSVSCAHQIKIGAEYQITSDINISGGYHFISNTLTVPVQLSGKK